MSLFDFDLIYVFKLMTLKDY